MGIAPWYIAARAKKGVCCGSLGSGEVCSEYQTILTNRGREAEVAIALADWLDTTGLHHWDLLHLPSAEADDPAVAALSEDVRAAAMRFDVRPAMSCSRTSWLPNGMVFSNARLAHERGSGELIGQIFRLGPGRRAQSGKRVRAGSRIPSHGRAASAPPAEPGSGRLLRFVGFSSISRGGLPPLSCLRHAKVAVDRARQSPDRRGVRFGWRPTRFTTIRPGLEPEAYQDDPGWLGMIGSVQRAIQDGYRWFDFLRGDEPYKSSWGAQPQMTVETRIVARHAAARLRHAAWLTQESVRQWARRNLVRLRHDSSRAQ